MGAEEETRRLDSKGRVTIPQSIRESLNLDPGEEVTVELDDGRVVVQPRVSRDQFIETMAGCVNTETRDRDAEPSDPLELKADWTEDLP